MRNMKFHGSKTEKMEHLKKSDITFETDFSSKYYKIDEFVTQKIPKN